MSNSIKAGQISQGEISLKIYPDESIEVDITGNLQSVLTDVEPLPVESMSLDLNIDPLTPNQTRVEGKSMIKIAPTYSEQVSQLDLVLDVHTVNSKDEITIRFKMPDYIGVEGTIHRSTDEATSETTITFELSATVYYVVAPKEVIQEITENFPLYKQQLKSQVSELLSGNVTIKELNLVSSSFDSVSATLNLSGTIIGDFNELASLMTQTIPQEIRTQALTMISVKSGDLHLEFDKVELAFKIDFDFIFEGDINMQANSMKNLLAEEYLQSPTLTPELTDVIKEIIIPTEIFVENLSTHYEFAITGQQMMLYFHLDCLRFAPPSTKLFLSSLNQALIENPLPGYDLFIEGGSDETGYLEIVVPQASSEPVENSKRTVAFTSNNIVNLDQISFEEREWPTSKITLNQTILSEGGSVYLKGTLMQSGAPLQGQIISLTANNNVIGSTRTDDDGGFSYIYRFEDSGTFEVKSTLNFYEKIVESQPILVTVSSPPILSANMVLPLVGGTAVLAAAVGVIYLQKRRAHLVHHLS